MSEWTTPADVRRRARRRWEDGSLARAYLSGEPCPRLDIPVRGPTASQIGPALARVRDWRDALVAGGAGGAAYDLSERAVGGRAIGRMTLPDRLSITKFGQWWRLAGVQADVAALDELAALTRSGHPELLAWVARRPLIALKLAPQWATLLSALDWLAHEANRGRFLRQVTAAGVDTKFVERHQGVLGELLAVLAARPDAADLGPARPIDADLDVDLDAGDLAPAGDQIERRPAGRDFAQRHGFRSPERLVHLRVSPPLPWLPDGLDQIALLLRDAARLVIHAEQVLIIENQVTFLSVPIPERGVVIWGHGFDAARLGALPWLRTAERVRYWGDLDTHGFAILSALRTQVPQTESVLMDRATLLANRDRWGTEPRPTRADLTALHPDERRLYEELVGDAYGPSVRLEQEREDWAWCLRELERAGCLSATTS